MKNKIIISFIIFVLLVLIITLANSYVKALQMQEELEIPNKTYNNLEETRLNCYNNCIEKETCKLYTDNGYCINQDRYCTQNNNYQRNCHQEQHCKQKMCNR